MSDGQTTFDLFEDVMEIQEENKDLDFSIDDLKSEYTLNTEELNSIDATLEIDNNLFSEDNVTTFTTVGLESDIGEDIIEPTIITKTEELISEFKVIDNVDEEISIIVEEKEDILTNNDYGKVNIMVVGIGGCGCNAIDRMYLSGNGDIQLVAMDTSEKTLENISSNIKVLIGEEEFKGHGSGGNLERTEHAFDNAKAKIQNILKDIDMLFVAGGIGSATGSIGLIKIGEIAREMGILTIGFATLPKKVEVNLDIVEKYYPLFLNSMDSTIVVENEKIASVVSNMSIMAVANMADKMLVDGIKGVYELITKPGKINLDYADIKTAFANQGSAIMGIGYGKGEDAVVKAIEDAVKSDIIDWANVSSAQTIIFNITCRKHSITIEQASKGTEYLYSIGSYDKMKHLLFGYSYDDNLIDEVKVTFIATGTKENSIDYYSDSSSFKANTSTMDNNIFVDTLSFDKDSKKEKIEEEIKDDRPDFFNL